MTDNLREIVDLHHKDVTSRLKRIETKLDTGHSHHDKVSWAALVPILVTVLIAVGLLS
jgi:hypothetical protein